VKMLYVNLCNLFYCCFFSFLCVDFCCTFCSVLSIIFWWIRMYIYRNRKISSFSWHIKRKKINKTKRGQNLRAAAGNKINVWHSREHRKMPYLVLLTVKESGKVIQDQYVLKRINTKFKPLVEYSRHSRPYLVWLTSRKAFVSYHTDTRIHRHADDHNTCFPLYRAEQVSK